LKNYYIAYWPPDGDGEVVGVSTKTQCQRRPEVGTYHHWTWVRTRENAEYVSLPMFEDWCNRCKVDLKRCRSNCCGRHWRLDEETRLEQALRASLEEKELCELEGFESEGSTADLLEVGRPAGSPGPDGGEVEDAVQDMNLDQPPQPSRHVRNTAADQWLRLQPPGRDNAMLSGEDDDLGSEEGSDSGLGGVAGPGLDEVGMPGGGVGRDSGSEDQQQPSDLGDEVAGGQPRDGDELDGVVDLIYEFKDGEVGGQANDEGESSGPELSNSDDDTDEEKTTPAGPDSA
jgi:hypothetical protein